MVRPDHEPPGTQYKVRLSVHDDQADRLFRDLSRDVRLGPNFLFVFSEHTYTHAPDDFIDGVSDTELEFNRYKRRINDFGRTVFAAASVGELTGRHLSLRVKLGEEVARRVFAKPVFPGQYPGDELAVRYRIPGETDVDSARIEDLKAYLSESPRRVYDELLLVTPKTAPKPFIIRSREARDDILQA
ncbi:hypothetical protein LRY29_01475 [Candidatus Saccharibacteria bacterium]|nr:hypothetical protein [Candidatus Saccharibacteria bacterium]